MTSNPHEQHGREVKAAKLIAELDRVRADLDYVAHMGPVEWAVCSHGAGVKHPSDETKRIVIATFARRQQIRDSLPANPLEGIGTRG